MTEYLFATAEQYDISLTLNIYDNWKQITRRKFLLRNLQGDSETLQIDHAKEILDEVAQELHYITRFGIDKGVITINQKKVAEIVYPQYQPDSRARYFIDGVQISSYGLLYWAWVNGQQRRERISKELLVEGWERKITIKHKKMSFRLPCFWSNSKTEEEKTFFQLYPYHNRRKKGWTALYDRDDPLYVRFIQRFQPNGNLAFGNDKTRYWSQEGERSLELAGISWTLPKFNQKKVPRKSRIASQPIDNTDYVYIIRQGKTKIYKIGKSNDPQGRLTSLQTANPNKLKLMHIFKADNASNAEETLQIALRANRRTGEWFHLTDEQRDTLLSITEYKDGLYWIKEQGHTVHDLL